MVDLQAERECASTAEPLVRDPRQNLNYRARMECSDGGDWLDKAKWQLSNWLRGKKDWDLVLTEDGEFSDATRSFQILHHVDAHARSFRARLVEHNTVTGTWTTELLAHDAQGQDDWLRVYVESQEGRFVDVPWLARHLIETLHLGDSTIEFGVTPRIFHEGMFDELIELLCDEERHGLVFVAACDDGAPSFDRFLDDLKTWTKEVHGLGEVIALTPDGQARLQHEIGEHSVQPGFIRTYYPAVDPASSVDSRRHRFITAERLRSVEPRAVANLLGRAARLHVAKRPTPPDVVRLRRTFQRLENRSILAALEADSTVVPEAAPPEPLRVAQDDAAEQVKLTQSILRLPEITAATLNRIASIVANRTAERDAFLRAQSQITSLQQRLEKVEDDFRAAELILDEGHLERAELQEYLEAQAAEVNWLRDRLSESGDHQAAYAKVPDEWQFEYPPSFAVMLSRLDEMRESGVVFTGDPHLAVALDDQDTLQVAVRTAWDVFAALRDYVRARNDGAFDRGVDDYLRETPHGYCGLPPGKHSKNETKETMRKYGEERVFTVPENVDETKRVEMTAHFRLAAIGMISPRLYYLDRWTKDGHIYVGYIGPHLKNTQTN